MMVSSASQLVTGNVGGALQLWSVDHTHSPPSISMAKTMEVDGGIFSAAFDSKMELVKKYHTCSKSNICSNKLTSLSRVWLVLHLAQYGTLTGLT